VGCADRVLRFMARDIRSALPNSVRTRTNGTIVAVEMMNTIDGGRYRSTGSTSVATQDQELDFTAADAVFSTVGRFNSRASYSNGYLAIYSISAAEIYGSANGTRSVMAGPSQIDIVANPLNADEDQVTLSPNFQFKYQSPSHRAYIVSGPVTYLCDTTAKTLQRYDGYAVNSNQANRDTDAKLVGAGAQRSLIANDASACQFTYAAGSPWRAALVTLRLTLSHTTQGNAAESVQLLRQVHLENTP
jgi:MSHA biogenesis protein MshO